uniref:CEP170 C-terminal domain-containing protein n=1 Tax=Clastoptera arizonana TaxID=38151 RepID=A0A1B6D2F0_9HEMI
MNLDSGGESDIENNSLSQVAHETIPATDSSASESSHKPSTTRYNRAFSLRRGRLDEAKKEPSFRESILSKTKSLETPLKAIPPRITRRDPVLASTPAPSFSRTDCGRFSMRAQKPSPQSPPMSSLKKDVKKKSGSCNRSNSTLSSKEVEFQNWKRRKSYDPMKAAAEGKKKEAARKQPPVANPMTQSTITTPKSPVNPVLRSASFHGTRQLVVSSSDDEEEEVILSAEEEDWPVLQVPRSSLENTPKGSHVSLYSTNSTSSLRARPKLETNSRTKMEINKCLVEQEEKGVDTLVISALSGLSHKLKGNSCNLLKKLRYLYDEDSPKGHQLNAEIEQLEASEPGSPQVKSPSRELSTTLRNLKRIENMLKVLDDVLFDEEDFQ